jgi:hypothetical protein
MLSTGKAKLKTGLERGRLCCTYVKVVFFVVISHAVRILEIVVHLTTEPEMTAVIQRRT